MSQQESKSGDSPTTDGRKALTPSVSRRGLLQATIASVAISPVAAVASADDDGLTIEGAAHMRPESVPSRLEITRTEIEVEWSETRADDELTINFNIRPGNGDTDYETLGSHTFTPDGEAGSKTITEDELFDGEGPVTDHSDVELENFAIGGSGEPTCKARDFDAQVEIMSDMEGALGTLYDDFPVIYVLDTGVGYYIGRNIGLKYPDFSDPDAVDYDGDFSQFPVQAEDYGDGVEQFEEILSV